MKHQKTIGILYLTIAITGGFSMGYFPLKFIHINDFTLTFNNLKENIQLFKYAILGDSIVTILELFLSVLLYQFFKKTDKFKSLLAMVSRLAMTVIMLVNIAFYITPLKEILNHSEITDAFISGIQSHFYTVYIWQFFFGIHMLALASLICKQLLFSKILAIGIFIGGIGYIVDCLNNLFQIQNSYIINVTSVLLAIAACSEIYFAIQLLIKKKL